jgi:DegV family protein with EDD domain
MEEFKLSDYRITCCSTVDLSADYLKEKDIPFACFHFQMDGKDYPDDLGKSISFEEFYKRIAAGAMPTTSQVNVEQYISLFEPLLKQGMDILHISLSSGISGAVNSARIAQGQLQQQYPERKIMVVDSLAASSGYGMLVDAVWEMQNSGASIDKVYAWLEENKLRLHHWFFSTDLRHYKRGGRISAASAVIGTILTICPLMNVNSKGELKIRKKIHGKNHVYQEIVRMMIEHADNGTDYNGKCFISNSACHEDARTVADLIKETFPNLDGDVLINSIGTGIGSHTGPGTVALFFWGDKRED